MHYQFHEFRHGAKRDKTHYTNPFRMTCILLLRIVGSMLRPICITCTMFSMILNVTNKDADVAVFHEIQTFMYAILEYHLKTDKWTSLVSQYINLLVMHKAFIANGRSIHWIQRQHNCRVITRGLSLSQRHDFQESGVVHHMVLLFDGRNKWWNMNNTS